MTSSQAPVEPGGIVRVLCDTTDDRRIIADITAETVSKLHCGCWSVRATRPGPDVGEYTCRGMEVLFRVCSYPHDDGSGVDGTKVPAPVVVQRTAATTHPADTVDAELFARTAPAWNCVGYPGDGMHYTPGPNGRCVWCGKSRDQIRAEREQREAQAAAS